MPQPAQSFVFYISCYIFVINCFFQFFICFESPLSVCLPWSSGTSVLYIGCIMHEG
jgi:hypothetical protein